MKHARRDYDRIQDPHGIIPKDEPVFLLRGKDVAAPDTVEFWAKEAREYGAAPDIIECAQEQAHRMRNWQAVVEAQTPDLPDGDPSSRPETKGEYMVGVDFNPSGDSDVDNVKRQAAAMIDHLERLKDDLANITTQGEQFSQRMRLLAMAITHFEEGAMAAVKAITKRPRRMD